MNYSYNSFIKQALIEMNNEYKSVLSKLKDKGYEIVKTLYKSDEIYTNGNISIDYDLIGKYSNVLEMINFEKNNYYNINVLVNDISLIPELINIDITKIQRNEIFKIAKDIFYNYNKENVFINNGNKIIVSNGDIRESINKILSVYPQKELLKEHLQVFSSLSEIIGNAKLSSQEIECEGRKNNNIWSYYLYGVVINKEHYLIEFDVISRNDGENHYRVQRLTKINKKS